MTESFATLPVLTPAQQATLAARLGEDAWRRRLARQRTVEVHPISNHPIARQARRLALFLRMTGVAGWGRRNLLAVRREENVLQLRGLPAALRGRRILHLSDVHMNLDPGIVPAVIRAITGWDYDAVALTGDYHTLFQQEWKRGMELCLEGCRDLTRALRPGAPVFAVLGNHDTVEMTPALEALGWRVLLNEAAPWRCAGAELWIAGVDDDYAYHTADVERARTAVPPGACALLLSHAPSTYARAAAAGFAAQLSGHNHGGQFCLPGGYAIINNSAAPRAMLRGPWEFQGMSGYTSRGAGACMVAARFFCPPEVTRHTLEEKL